MSEPLLQLAVPGIEEYRELRMTAGLSPKSEACAALGLPASWCAACLRDDRGRLVGMGRVIGDGGCFFQIVDVAVRPELQGRGLGKRIMRALLDELRRRAPAGALVTLLADGEAWRLYQSFGFQLSAPASQGMLLRL